ncbi:hypothetical protein K502DRAFT_330529 [Neoconidiobolus thromboides FSU 785]|nr:hypothetical protein K502DRAFT_330529 [Neoconidiobolus thromboides FSU 785]
MSHQSIAKIYGIGRSTVTKILLRKDDIIKESKGVTEDERKRIRVNHSVDIERKVFEWFGTSLKRNNDGNLLLPLQYNKQAIINKANEIAVELSKADFIADKKWLKRFCRRFKLKFESNTNDSPIRSSDSLSSSNTISSLHGSTTHSNYLIKDIDNVCSVFGNIIDLTKANECDQVGSSVNPDNIQIQYSKNQDQSAHIDSETQFRDPNDIIDLRKANSSKSKASAINDLKEIINNINSNTKVLSEQLNKLSQRVASITQNVVNNNVLFSNLDIHINTPNQFVNSYISSINQSFNQNNTQFHTAHQSNPYSTTQLINSFFGQNNIQFNTTWESELINDLM